MLGSREALDYRKWRWIYACSDQEAIEIGAQRPLLYSGNHSEKDFSAGSPVVNEVALGTSVERGKRDALEDFPTFT